MDTLTQSNRRSHCSKPVPGQVAKTLRERIRSGHYQVGYTLPSERALVEDLSVDRRTIRAAIAQLKNEGILDVRRYCRPVIHSSIPNLFASRLIALVMLPSADDNHAGCARQRVFWGINEGLSESGYHGVCLDLAQSSVGACLNKAEREMDHLNYALNYGFGGVVFQPQAYNSNRDLVRKISKQVPLVLLDRQMPGVQADFVGIDNRQSASEATWDLIHQGHKRIAFLTSGEFSNTERLEGYFQALNEAFPEDPYEMILTPPLNNSREWSMFEAICRLPAEKRPTGIVCSNKDEAVRAAGYLSALNIRVPEGVSLIGSDDIGRTLYSGSGQTATPFEIGKAAAKLILRRCQDPSVDPAHVELPAGIVARDVINYVCGESHGLNG